MRRLTSCTVLLAFAAVAAMAQDEDPPSRVARLNHLEGPVSFRPGSVDDWTAATLNYPLTTGDHLWSDTGARAELHIGSTAIRLSSATALAVLNLDDRIVQLSLTEGSLNVHIRYLGTDEAFEVDTPNVAISLLRPGDYRIDANGDNATTYAVVRAGEAEAAGGGAQFIIHAGESASISGLESVSQEMGAAPARDDFDAWSAVRDRRENSVASVRYVPRETIGYEDLDTYGEWRYASPYGWVWAPTTVMVGWAPYRDGHWVWVAPWGWTWIDDAPWGFAPFHYGRWAFATGGWVWVPGAMVVGVRPVYAPALVAFVGGPRFGVAMGIGGGGGVAAWFPLGPGEVYRPAYRVSNVYVQNVNITHVTNVTVINNVNVTNVHYVNQNVNGAVTAVPQNVFVSARSVGRAAIMIPRGAMAESEIVGHAPSVVPTRESVLAARPAGFQPPPTRFVSREVVASHTPPAGPVSFAAQEQALRSNGGRPLAPEQVNSYRSSGYQTRTMTRSATTPAGANTGAGQHFGAPRGGTVNPGTQVTTPPANNAPGNTQRPTYHYDRPPASQPAIPSGGSPAGKSQGSGSVNPGTQNANPPVNNPPAGSPPSGSNPSGSSQGGGSVNQGTHNTNPPKDQHHEHSAKPDSKKTGQTQK